MRTKLVVFDSDGVLVDSEPLIKIAQVTGFTNQGANISAAWAYVNLHGLRAVDVVKAVEAYTGVVVDKAKYQHDFDEIFDKLIEEKLQATQGIHAVLQKLKDAAKTICVASSAPLLNSHHKLEVTGVLPFIGQSAVFSGEQVTHGKPAPDIMLFAAKNMGFNPADCTVIEDAPFGIQAAKAAGMYAIGYMGGGHVQHTQGLTADALYAAGADIVIHHHDELFDVIP